MMSARCSGHLSVFSISVLQCACCQDWRCFSGRNSPLCSSHPRRRVDLHEQIGLRIRGPYYAIHSLYCHRDSKLASCQKRLRWLSCVSYALETALTRPLHGCLNLSLIPLGNAGCRLRLSNPLGLAPRRLHPLAHTSNLHRSFLNFFDKVIVKLTLFLKPNSRQCRIRRAYVWTAPRVTVSKIC